MRKRYFRIVEQLLGDYGACGRQLEVSLASRNPKKALMANGTFGDAARDNIRAIVATIDLEISQLPPIGADHEPTNPNLRASWAELVKLLALGPAPETRRCPACNGIGMRAASRCGQCWAKLEPLDSHEGPRSDA